MAGDLTSTAEVGVMTRQMADRHAEGIGRLFVEQISDRIDAKARAFKPSGDNSSDARAMMASLAEVFDETSFEELQDAFAEAVFQAAAVGVAATPLTGKG